MRPALLALLLILAGSAAEKPIMTVPADWSAVTDAEWQQRLTPERYAVLRRKGTEPPFCGGYSVFKHNGAGTYHCGGCGLMLFRSDTSFDSGSGWPSFFRPVEGAVETENDASHGMNRSEVHCQRCKGHLGHVFEDGPAPTGLRYCINAVSIDFHPKGEVAVFAGGCFWGVEAVFRAVPGVLDARVGYAGGRTEKPTYREVCGHGTGHAEVCEVQFDPAKVSFGQLLVVFFENHDPTTKDRQGPDVGDQYRSAIFAQNAEQRSQAEAFIKAIDAAHRFRAPVVTQVADAATFWPAEDYHQNYFAKQGDACHRPHGIRLGDLLPVPVK